METKKYYGGALFVNRNKAKPSQPDLSGDAEMSMEMLKVLVDLAKQNKPLKFRMAAWTKEGKNGKFYSVQFSEDKKQDTAPPRRQSFVDDDIPF